MSLFDFNHDGKTSWDEHFLAGMMFWEIMKNDEEDDAWRDDCEDGLDYDVDSEDYDTEEE